MAHHASAKKRIRSNQAKRAQNHYQHKTARTFIRRLLGTQQKADAQTLFPKLCSMIDKLVKRGIWHRNKADRHKSRLALHVNKLS